MEAAIMEHVHFLTPLASNSPIKKPTDMKSDERADQPVGQAKA